MGYLKVEHSKIAIYILWLLFVTKHCQHQKYHGMTDKRNLSNNINLYAFEGVTISAVGGCPASTFVKHFYLKSLPYLLC